MDTGAEKSDQLKSLRSTRRLRTLINDQHLDALPLATSDTVFLDLANEQLDGVASKSNASERMNRRSSDVAGGHSGGSGDSDGIGSSLVFTLERGDNLTQENRLARS